MANFGARLKELRLSTGKTQGELGEILGISASTVGMYEQGRREPDRDTLLKMSEYFTVSVDYLIGSTKSYDLEDILNNIKNQPTILYNGKPLSIDSAELVEAMDLAARIVIEKNKGKKDEGNSY